MKLPGPTEDSLKLETSAFCSESIGFLENMSHAVILLKYSHV